MVVMGAEALVILEGGRKTDKLFAPSNWTSKVWGLWRWVEGWAVGSREGHSWAGPLPRP